MPTRLLCLGDLHLGRSPRLPAGADLDLSPADLGPRAAWERSIDLALRERIDAVLLAGDVVDGGNARFEAFGPLQRGVAHLLEAGIAVCAVAGNHDVEALPRLAGLLGDFRLLGAGGRWEQAIVGTSPPVRVVGWSFPAAHHPDSPLAAGAPPAGPAAGSPGAVTVGLLHADLEDPGSRYAPVRADELARLPGVAAWLLGHVHRPTLAPGPRPLGYLGSVVGLDPSETGPHGPWLVEVGEGGSVRLRHLPLAPLRWERMIVDLDGLDDPAAGLERRLRDALAGAAEEAVAQTEAARAGVAGMGTAGTGARRGTKAATTTAGEEPDCGPLPPPLAVGCRIGLTGRVGRRADLRRDLSALGDRFAMTVPGGGPQAFLAGEVADGTRPALDLAELARGGDPAALLAADLARLEAAEGDADLLARARERLRGVADQRDFADLEPWSDDDGRVRALLLSSGWRALERLLAGREARS